eukprot:1179631-Prorocentrum_minimum.AAC.2
MFGIEVKENGGSPKAAADSRPSQPLGCDLRLLFAWATRSYNITVFVTDPPVPVTARVHTTPRGAFRARRGHLTFFGRLTPAKIRREN